jgi:hypothetical protein
MMMEAVLLGLGVLVWKKLGQGHEWTAEHEEMYQNALEHLKGEAGVAKLREIANACEKNGHHAKAFALRKRAELRSAPAAVKVQRHEAYLKGMQSENIAGILKLAAALESISATGAAKNLRDRADALQAKKDGLIPDPPEPPVQARVEPEPAAPEERPAPQPRVAEAEPPSVASEGLQEVRASTRTTPAPPPLIEAVGEVVSEHVEVLNGAGAHVEPKEDASGASA